MSTFSARGFGGCTREGLEGGRGAFRFVLGGGGGGGGLEVRMVPINSENQRFHTTANTLQFYLYDLLLIIFMTDHHLRTN